jgi:hypothetical protein
MPQSCKKKKKKKDKGISGNLKKNLEGKQDHREESSGKQDDRTDTNRI